MKNHKVHNEPSRVENAKVRRRARSNFKKPLLFLLYLSCTFLLFFDAVNWSSAKASDTKSASGSEVNVKSKQGTQSEYKEVFSYQPTGGLGIRFSQHFFPNVEDRRFNDGKSHTAQSLERRHRNIENFALGLDDVEYVHPSEPEHSITKSFVDEQPDPTRLAKQMMISHTYYQPKWKVFETDKQGIAFIKAGSATVKSEVQPEQAAQQKAEKRLPELDLKRRHTLKSQEITMGTGQKTEHPIDRAAVEDSSVLAHAFGWRESAEMSVERIEENEAQQVVEDMFTKMAKRHHIDNYQTFVRVLGETTVNDQAVINKRFFYRDPTENHPIRTPGVLLSDIVPRDLALLRSSNYMAKFFESTVTIEPHYVHMEDMNLLLPRMEEIYIENKSLKDPQTVDFVVSSTPEILFFHIKDNYNHQAPSGLPLELQPRASVKITMMLIPESLGEIDAVVYIGLNRKFVYMIPVKAFVHVNKFGLEPLYFNYVNVGETVEYKLHIKNELGSNVPPKVAGTESGAPDGDLNIQEAYSTEPYLKLLWPNKTPVENSMLLSQAPQKDYSKYTKIPSGTTKHVLTIQFETQLSVDHRAVIHMFTDSGVLIRLPCYFHVSDDIVRFLPPVVDFGVLPWRFNVLRIPVTVQVRKPGVQAVFLTDVLLPLNDERLDFVMGKWTDDKWKKTSQTEAFLTSSKTPQSENPYEKYKDVFASRNGPVTAVEADSEGVMVLTVLLDPYKAGRLHQEIQFVFSYQDGARIKQFKVQLPIIGYVGIQRNMLTSVSAIGENFRPEVIYEPAVDIRVSSYSVFNVPYVLGFCPVKPKFTNEILPGLLMSPKDQPKTVLYRDLTLVNMLKVGNLTIDIENVEIWNDNPEIVFRRKKDPEEHRLTVQDQEYSHWTIGQFFVHPDDLKVTSGTKYFTMVVNNAMFTQAIDIRDWSLLCQIEEEFAAPKYEDCRSMSSQVDFGRIGFYQPKTRQIHITNLSSLPITLISLEKSQDEVIVDLVYPDESIYADPQAFHRTTATEISHVEGSKQYYDSSGAISKRKKAIVSAEDEGGVKQIKQTIYPKSTITLSLTAEGTYSTVPGASTSVTKHAMMTLRYSGLNLGTRAFTINYGYKVLPGSFGFVNHMASLPPCLPGQIITSDLNAINRFQAELHIRSISTTDLRIKPKLLHTVVPPLSDAGGLVQLTFDPAVAFKKGQQIIIKDRDDTSDGILYPTASHVHVVNLRAKDVSQPPPEKKQKGGTYLKRNKQNDETDANGNYTLHLMFNHTEYMTTDWQSFMEKNGGKLMTKHELARWRQAKVRDMYKPSHKPAPVWVNGEWRDDVSETINAQIRLDTDIVQGVSINVTAFVQEPRIIQQKTLDFGILHVGSSSALDFEVLNPFNETMSVQLFLGRRDQTWDNHWTEYQLKEREFDYDQQEAAQEKGVHKVLNHGMRQELYQKVPFMSTYCRNIDIFEPKEEETDDWEPLRNFGLDTEDIVIHLDEQTDLHALCPQLLFDYIFNSFDVNFRMNKSLPYYHPLASHEKQPDWKLRKGQHANIWLQAEQFFKQKLLQALEKTQGAQLSISAITDPMDIIEAMKNDALDFVKYPEALEITTESDSEAVENIIRMTFARSQLWNPDNFQEFNKQQQKAYDEARRHSWLYTKLTNNIFAPIHYFTVEFVVNPVQSAQIWWQTQQNEPLHQKSINILKMVFTTLYETFRRTFVNKQKPVVVRINEDFQFDPQIFPDDDDKKPSLFLSQFFSMTDKQLHNEVLQNNGTTQFQTSLQNFFVAPPFQGIPIEVRPQDHVKILESIVFEPKALSTLDQMSMTVFLTTNRSEVLSVDVTGSTGSALLDIAKISMLKFTESGRKENFPIEEYNKVFNKGCTYLYDPISVLKDVDAVPVVEPITPEDRSNCIGDSEIATRLQKELFSESTVTRTLNFVIGEEDLAPGGAQELAFMESQFDFWTSLDLVYMKWAYTEQELNEYKGEKRRNTYDADLQRIQSYGQVREDKLVKENKEYAKYYILQTGLENEFAWFLKIFNKGNLAFEADEVGFEVPGEDKLQCATEEFALIYCSAGTFLPQRVTRKTVGIKFKADYSVPKYQKVLTFRNKRITQRFIVNLEITDGAMKVAQQYQHLNYDGDEFKIAEAYLISLTGRYLMFIGLWIIIKRNYIVLTWFYNTSHKDIILEERTVSTKRDEQVSLGELNVIKAVTPASVLCNYTQASEKFANNQALFLKESINLTQRKNSFTLDYLRKQLQSQQKSQRGQIVPEQSYLDPESGESPRETYAENPPRPPVQIAPLVRKPAKLIDNQQILAKKAAKKESGAEVRKVASTKVAPNNLPVKAEPKVKDSQKKQIRLPTSKPSDDPIAMHPSALLIPDDDEPESGESTPANATTSQPTAKNKPARMSKKDRKACEKRMKEYQETINNQLLSEKKEREQAALEEIRRAEAEAEEARAKDAAEQAKIERNRAATVKAQEDKRREQVKQSKPVSRKDYSQKPQKRPIVSRVSKSPVSEQEDMRADVSEGSSSQSDDAPVIPTIVYKKKAPLHQLVENTPKPSPSLKLLVPSGSNNTSFSEKPALSERTQNISLKSDDNTLRVPEDRDKQSQNSSQDSANKSQWQSGNLQRKPPPEPAGAKPQQYAAKQGKYPVKKRRPYRRWQYGEEGEADDAVPDQFSREFAREEFSDEEEYGQDDDYYEVDDIDIEDYDAEIDDDYGQQEYGFEDEYRRPPSMAHYHGVGRGYREQEAHYGSGNNLRRGAAQNAPYYQNFPPRAKYPRQSSPEEYYNRKTTPSRNVPFSSKQTDRSAQWKAKRQSEHAPYPVAKAESNLRPLVQNPKIQRQAPPRYIDYASKPLQGGLSQLSKERHGQGLTSRAFQYPPQQKRPLPQQTYPQKNLHSIDDFQTISEEDYHQARAKQPAYSLSPQQQPQYIWQQKPQPKQQPEQFLNEDPIGLSYSQDQFEEEQPENSESEENESGMQFAQAFKSIKSIFSSNKQQTSGVEPIARTALYGGLGELSGPEAGKSSWLQGTGRQNYFDAFNSVDESSKKPNTLSDLLRNSRPLNYDSQDKDSSPGGDSSKQQYMFGRLGRQQEDSFEQQDQYSARGEAPQVLFQSLMDEKSKNEDQNQSHQGLGFKQLNFQWKELSPFNSDLANALPGQTQGQQQQQPSSLPTLAGVKAMSQSQFQSPLFNQLIGRGSESSGRSRRSSRVEEDENTSQKGNYSLFS